jgi:hypothetical protein
MLSVNAGCHNYQVQKNHMYYIALNSSLERFRWVSNGTSLDDC